MLTEYEGGNYNIKVPLYDDSIKYCNYVTLKEAILYNDNFYSKYISLQIL